MVPLPSLVSRRRGLVHTRRLGVTAAMNQRNSEDLLGPEGVARANRTAAMVLIGVLELLVLGGLLAYWRLR